MKNEILFLYAISAALSVFAIADLIHLALIRKKTRETTGIIVDTRCAAAKTMRVYNSKWAVINHTADGKTYRSENRITVPMDARIGDRLPIQYYIGRPEKICRRSVKRPLIVLAMGVVFLLIALANSLSAH